MKLKLMKAFEETYGIGGDIRAFFAPGRVNLIGEHTDYNGGHVLPCTLHMGTYMVVRKRNDSILNFYSINMKELGIITSNLDELYFSKEADWTNYTKGVLWALVKEGYEVPCGMDVFVYGTIPGGAGLSSSASLEIVTALAVKELFGFSGLSLIELAKLCQYAENNYIGCNCGIMDQFVVAMGKKNHCMFLNTNDLTYQYVPLDLSKVKIVVTNSKVKHSLVDSQYNKRRSECEKALSELQSVVTISSLGDLSKELFDIHETAIKDPVLRLRARHAVYENQRTIEATKALKEENLMKFGRLMNDSHRSLRDDYQVSCEEIDCLVELAWNHPGTIGSRITGGGFGGCTVSIVNQDSVDSFIDHLRKGYQHATGYDAEFYLIETGDGVKELL
ncbi:galactokinase [Anoxybacterium hadale]|uniref:Galactokinase n=1 Tax=Anoxybacterium hadale TaxID=3408580 RepID=A0ACD1AGX8_9FIRM|nr:galactokinase [Clostridiales bacterium]